MAKRKEIMETIMGEEVLHRLKEQFYKEFLPNVPLEEAEEIMRRAVMKEDPENFRIWVKMMIWDISRGRRQYSLIHAARVLTFDEVLAENGLLPEGYGKKIRRNLEKLEAQVVDKEGLYEFPEILLPAGGEGEA